MITTLLAISWAIMADINFTIQELAKNEGLEVHKDIKGILTGPYGVVIDPNDAAYKNNLEVANSLGIEKLDKNTSVSDFKKVATQLVINADKILSSSIPNYNKLNEKQKFVVIDAKFNTNDNYIKLTNAFIAYEENPTQENKNKVIIENRRVSDGKALAGLDNRAAKTLFSAGFIGSLSEAIEGGLSLANEKSGLTNTESPKSEQPLIPKLTKSGTVTFEENPDYIRYATKRAQDLTKEGKEVFVSEGMERTVIGEPVDDSGPVPTSRPVPTEEPTTKPEIPQ